MAGSDNEPPVLGTLTTESVRQLEALRRALQRSDGFSLHLVVGDGPALTEARRYLEGWARFSRIPELAPLALADGAQASVSDGPSTGFLATALRTALEQAATATGPHAWLLADGEAVTNDGDALALLNVARDRLGEWLRGPLVVLLSESAAADWAARAPDLFDVRAATHRVAVAALCTLNMLADQAWLKDLRLRAAKTGPSTTVESSEALHERAQWLSGPASADLPPGARVDEWLRVAAGWLALGERAEALAATQTAAQLARASGYPAGVAHALRIRAETLHGHAALEEESEPLKEAIAIWRELGSAQKQVQCWLLLAEVACDHAAFEQALAYVEQDALPLARQLQDDGLLVKLATLCGNLLGTLGRHDDSTRVLEREALPVARRLGDAEMLADVWVSLADAARRRGRTDEARRLLTEEALPSAKRAETPMVNARVSLALARLEGWEKNWDDALRIVNEEVLPAMADPAHDEERATVLAWVASVESQRGRRDTARNLLAVEVLPVAEREGDVGLQLEALNGLACIANECGQRGEASRLFQRALALSTRTARRVEELEVLTHLYDMEIREIWRILETVQTDLGESASPAVSGGRIELARDHFAAADSWFQAMERAAAQIPIHRMRDRVQSLRDLHHSTRSDLDRFLSQRRGDVDPSPPSPARAYRAALEGGANPEAETETGGDHDR